MSVTTSPRWPPIPAPTHFGCATPPDKQDRPEAQIADQEQKRVVGAEFGNDPRRRWLDRDAGRGGRLGAFLVDVDESLVDDGTDAEALLAGDAAEIRRVGERRPHAHAAQRLPEAKRGRHLEPRQGDVDLGLAHPGQPGGQVRRR